MAEHYHAAGESETPGDQGPTCPMGSSGDVADAWKLRKGGDYSISTSTLERRIISRAGDLGCPDSKKP